MTKLLKISFIITLFIIILQYLPQNSLASEKNWGEKIRVTDDDFEDVFPSLIQSQNGIYWIAWSSNRSGNYDIFISKSVNRKDWENPHRIIISDYEDVTQSLIQDSKGIFWLAFASNRSGDYNIWLSSSSDGIKWESPQQITNDKSRDFTPCLIQDKNDKYWIVWSKTKYNNSDIWITSSIDGKNWDNPKSIINNSLEDITPCLIQDNDEIYRLTWVSNRTKQNNVNDYNIWISSSSDGYDWGHSYRVTNDSKQNDVPSLIQDNEGKFWITWCSVLKGSFDFYDIWISKSTDGVNWGIPDNVISQSIADLTPSLIQDSDGRFIISWSSLTINGFRSGSNTDTVFENTIFEIWICSTYKKEKNKDEINYDILIIIAIVILIIFYIFYRLFKKKG